MNKEMFWIAGMILAFCSSDTAGLIMGMFLMICWLVLLITEK